MLIPLDWQSFAVKEKIEADKTFCFDPVRKKWLVAGSEEKVRQKFLSFLINDLHYPPGLIKIEHPLTWNKLSHRSDIVLYDRAGKPLMIIECKAPRVAVNQAVMNQASRYNITLRVKYLAVTNGSQTYCCSIDYDTGEAAFLPDFSFLQNGLVGS